MATYTYALHAPMPDACQGAVVTIGNFDGVHLGHQSLLTETARQAKALNASAVAVTFDPHPSQILRPDRIGPPLTTLEERAALLQEHGVHHVLILQTSPALLQLSAHEFFSQIVHQKLKATALVEGFNFGFGRDREGTIEVLRTLCAEKAIPLTLMPPREVAGAPVSSSRVRAELLGGRVDLVAQLLGRSYRIAGVVGTGQKRGATLGFPTANLHQIATLIPGDGVYAARAMLAGEIHAAAVNVGPNPTFGEYARKVEVHLIGFSGTLYDEILGVDFVRKIRETRSFGTVSELIAQLTNDVAEVQRSVPV
jgi:riboflavin kinase / FMN adenylyltransferase